MASGGRKVSLGLAKDRVRIAKNAESQSNGLWNSQSNSHVANSGAASTANTATISKLKCCQCQANRRCVRCACVQAGRRCFNCYPGRNSPTTCANQPSGKATLSSQPVGKVRTEKGNHVPMPPPSSRPVTTNDRPDLETIRRISVPATGRMEVVSTCATRPLSCRPVNVAQDGSVAHDGSVAQDGICKPLRSNSQQPAVSDDVAALACRVRCASLRGGSTRESQPKSQPSSCQPVSAARNGNSKQESLLPTLSQPAATDVVVAKGSVPRPRSQSDVAVSSMPEQEELLIGQSPSPTPMAPPANRPWSVTAIYDEIVHWSKRFFAVPNNSAGKALIYELAKLLQAFVDSGGTEMNALYSFMVLPALVLQIPPGKCSYQDASHHLRRRLDLWAKNDLDVLMEEGQCIQKKCHGKNARFRGEEDLARQFGNCMSSARVHQAIRMLSESAEEASSGVLHLDDKITLGDGSVASVRALLVDKHPNSQSAPESALLSGDLPRVNNIRYEEITAALLQKIARQCRGSAGPSGLNAEFWRRICSSYKGASSSMCQALSNFARLLATQLLEPSALVPFLSCRLIALDKRPGVRPIGVCEVIRRITSKAILKVVGHDVEEACGYLQKCSGSPAGLEAAIHAMQNIYEDDSTEGILMVDARNAFNSLNREAALHNVQYLCPALSTCLHNCYQAPARLFVSGGGELASREGVTQGDPLSMPFYALATVPFIEHLHREHPSIRQAWLADDSAGAGRLRELRKWWDTLSNTGKWYGYFTNSIKSFLLVQQNLVDYANELFDGTGVQIVTEGVRYLGSAIGEQSFVVSYFTQKVDEWLKELEVLIRFAQTEPHAALAALTHGLRSKFAFLQRTLPDINETIQRLDTLLEQKFLPAISGRENFTADELALLRLPARLGGIGLPSFSAAANSELSASKEMTQTQVAEILHQSVPHQMPDTATVHKAAVQARNIAKGRRRKEQKLQLKTLRDTSTIDKRRLELLSAKGASSWLTVLPLKEHGFLLSRRDFRDALALRYDWQLESVPVNCVCGVAFSADHAMVCSFGGYPTVRHNELRDFLGSQLTEVCHNVAIEPLLTPLNGEVFQCRTTNTSQEARADVRAAGFWTRCEEAFFDIRVFHANATSYRPISPDELFRQHERRKQLEYEERIVNVDRGSFCPLVFSTTGAAGPLCDRFLKRLAAKIADKAEEEYSSTMSWLRCRISFALIRNAVMCIRGSRSSHRKPVLCDRSLAIAESRIVDNDTHINPP